MARPRAVPGADFAGSAMAAGWIRALTASAQFNKSSPATKSVYRNAAGCLSRWDPGRATRQSGSPRATAL